jgi:hypothetical protein
MISMTSDIMNHNQCDNCGKIYKDEELDEIQDLERRLDTDKEGNFIGEAPTGQCPKCGALCYAIKPAKTKTEAWTKKYTEYIHQHALSKMPDRGFGITGYPDTLSSKYTAFFKTRIQATRAGQYLANSSRHPVELGAIQDHGRRRFSIGEITPD